MITWVVGDDYFAMEIQLVYDNGNPVNIESVVSAEFQVQLRYGGTDPGWRVATLPMTKAAPASNGTLFVDHEDSDLLTDAVPQQYRAQVQLTYANNAKRTVPNALVVNVEAPFDGFGQNS